MFKTKAENERYFQGALGCSDRPVNPVWVEPIEREPDHGYGWIQHRHHHAVFVAKHAGDFGKQQRRDISQHRHVGHTGRPGGNVQLYGTFATGNSTGARFAIFARASALTVNYSSSTFYDFALDGGAGTFTVNKIVSGTLTNLFSVSLATSISANTWYQIYSTLNGSTLTFSCTRGGDFLDMSSGAFGLTPTFGTLTDSTISGQGYAGLSVHSPNAFANAYADDWDLATAGPIDFTLGTSCGTFALTGESADLLYDHQANAATGVFTLAGKPVPLTWGVIDSASAGAYALTGANAALEYGHTTQASAGSFTLTGAPASLAQSNNIAASCGQYTITGAKTSLLDDHQLAASAGSFELAGSSATLQQPATLNASGGVFALTGVPVGTYADRVNPASCGSYTLTGGVAVLTFEGNPGAVGYRIYANTGAGDPINYATPIATTTGLTWTSGTLSYPSQWSWGVRAFFEDSGLEEMNVDVVVTLVLSSSGQDITNTPPAPIGLRAFPVASGGIKVEFTEPPCSTAQTPTGFHCYAGTGTPNYGTVAATILYSSGLAGSFAATLTGFSNGQVVAIGVRAYNATGEEQNVNFVTATALSVGPSAVVGLVALATS